MKVIITDNYQESCRIAAEMIRDVIAEKPNAKLGLATGGTPVPIYKNLIKMNQQGEVDFASVHTVNLDEYIGLEGSHPQSYRYFMDTNLFDHININKANTYVAKGTGNPADNAAELEQKVFENGVPDLQLLGIGNNGHIAFNEAGNHLVAVSHIETLTESTIEANARFFDKKEDVPTTSITMGMRGILAAKMPLLVATGASKAEAIRGLLTNDEITTQNPSTFLKLHPQATVIIDKELAQLAGVQ
ncbi:glucosamine-6-phosphate deaminase [Ruminococcaceae bacterium OttesenSCG-928-A16]|nr:glucosamine-6-phosphate deaminase [Ruminococcaceae bacterium OttesenSCG-928-A16]